ncbi:hypothetical protein [Cohnella fermenti]|uniref:Uncharacterized protein n=1 Tax=Cohnella fermenti TaxID=2565925 RepID=A0A4V3WE12_9BACL|nr:hypothetical protein [Cohnella fermenti]THF74368.1 hypothetical protein E6C55_25330 [Cohnella fermenti]
MGHWRHQVSIGIDDLLEDSRTTVNEKGRILAERLNREACFRSFMHVDRFRSAQDAEELDEVLEQMYDYADRQRIWIRKNAS